MDPQLRQPAFPQPICARSCGGIKVSTKPGGFNSRSPTATQRSVRFESCSVQTDRATRKKCVPPAKRRKTRMDPQTKCAQIEATDIRSRETMNARTGAEGLRTLDRGTKTGHTSVCNVSNRAVEPSSVSLGVARARQIAPTDAPLAEFASSWPLRSCAAPARLASSTPGLSGPSILSHGSRRFCHIDSVVSVTQRSVEVLARIPQDAE